MWYFISYSTPCLTCCDKIVGWLQHIDLAKHKSPNDPNEAYCKICDQSLRSHLTDLQKHARSKKHRENSTGLDKTKYKSLISHGK